MKAKLALIASINAAILAAATSGMAQITYDQNINSDPGVYYGTGNNNGNWAVVNDVANNIQLGLRGKVYGLNTYPDAGNGIYTFDQGPSPINAARGTWNFDFSINVNASGAGSANLGSYTYLLLVDSDPTAGVAYTSVDPFTQYADNELAKVGGVKSIPGTRIYNGIGNLNNSSYDVAQNSENVAFGLPVGDAANFPGLYDIELQVLDRAGAVVASDKIQINVVPDASSTLPLLGAAVAGLAFIRRKIKA